VKQMISPIRKEVPIAKIDLTDTRLKFRRNFKEEAIDKKAKSILEAGLMTQSSSGSRKTATPS